MFYYIYMKLYIGLYNKKTNKLIYTSNDPLKLYDDSLLIKHINTFDRINKHINYNLSIRIKNYIFVILFKYINYDRDIVVMQSFNIYDPTQSLYFKVYKSKSQNLYRLLHEKNGHYTKYGHYSLGTLVCFELQKLINENFSNIYNINQKTLTKLYYYTDIYNNAVIYDNNFPSHSKDKKLDFQGSGFLNEQLKNFITTNTTYCGTKNNNIIYENLVDINDIKNKELELELDINLKLIYESSLNISLYLKNNFVILEQNYIYTNTNILKNYVDDIFILPAILSIKGSLLEGYYDLNITNSIYKILIESKSDNRQKLNYYYMNVNFNLDIYFNKNETLISKLNLMKEYNNLINEVNNFEDKLKSLYMNKSYKIPIGIYENDDISMNGKLNNYYNFGNYTCKILEYIYYIFDDIYNINYEYRYRIINNNYIFLGDIINDYFLNTSSLP